MELKCISTQQDPDGTYRLTAIFRDSKGRQHYAVQTIRPGQSPSSVGEDLHLFGYRVSDIDNKTGHR